MEPILDPSRHDGNRRGSRAEQDDQVVPRVLGVGDDEVGPPDRARYDLFQVAAQARVGAVRAHQKRQVVDRQDAARVAKRRQHEVRAVVDVDGSAEPVGRQGQLGPVPQNAEPALAKLDLAAREVVGVRKLRHAAAIRARVHQAVLVVLVKLGQRQNLVPHQPANARPLIDRG